MSTAIYVDELYVSNQFLYGNAKHFESQPVVFMKIGCRFMCQDQGFFSLLRAATYIRTHCTLPSCFFAFVGSYSTVGHNGAGTLPKLDPFLYSGFVYSIGGV